MKSMILHSELGDIAIARGFIELDDVLDGQKEYENFLKELEATWTPEAIRNFTVKLLREEYVASKKYKEKLEIQYKEARERGIPFSERKLLAKKIEAGDMVLEELVQKGKNAKKMAVTVRQLVTPYDAYLIKTQSFERWLSTPGFLDFLTGKTV